MLRRVVLRPVFLLLVVCLTLGSTAPARTDRLARRIGNIKVLFAGVSATVDPTNPVVPKNTPAGVRILLTTNGVELTPSEAEAFLGGPFEIVGELSGPGLAGAITLASETSSFLLPTPALNIAGDYTLSNLRIEVDSKPVLDVTPQQVPVRVIAQVLVTSVQTRPLTLEELKQRGVVFDGDDVVGFEFTLGMTLESKPVNITFPVVFDRQGVAVPQPLMPPAQPSRTGVGIDLPSFPTVIPLMLEAVDGTQLPEIELPGGGQQEIRIPSVLVIPGDVGFLKQFFSAQLFVANGAPAGSGLIVRDIEASIGLPPGPDLTSGTSDDPLALPELTTGIQPMTLPVVGVGADGEPGSTDDVVALAPGQQGQAEFLVRGESEGFHTLDFDIAATLDGLVTGPVQVKGRASGGVLVRNPFLDVTFTVPSVVRTQEPFKLYVNVRNIGDGLASRIDVSFNELALSGLKLADGADATQRIDTTLQKGDSATLVFDFEALRTGKVVATYLRFDSDAAADGTVNFTLGVGERNVPLSPDTLVLPASVDALPTSVVNAAMRVLGQAWSVANAPAGTLPPDVLRIRKNAVIEKALALAEGGLRVQLGETPPDAVRGFVLDLYGGETIDDGFDQLLRTTNAGHALASAFATELEPAVVSAGGLIPYERELAQLAASGADFVSVAVDSPLVEVAITDGTGQQTPDVASSALLSHDATGTLAVLTRPTASPYSLALTPTAAGSASIAATLPRGDGTFVRGTASVDFELGSQARLLIDLFRPESLEIEIDHEGDGIFETLVPLATESLASQGPTLVSATVIGPELLDGASSYGFHAAALFDRVVDEVSASDVSRYTIADNALRGAVPQLSGRLVFLTLERPEGPDVPASLAVEGVRDGRGVEGPARDVPLQSILVDAGAVVSGRVFNADGTPVSGGAIGYANRRSTVDCRAGEEVLFANVPLDADGRYQLHYVRQDPCGGPFRIIYVDPATSELRDVNGFVRTGGERIVLDLALFGRGAVTGIVTENGQPAPGAQVVVISATDAQSGGVATTDGDGRYNVYDIVVGPVSVKAARDATAGANSGRIARGGTTAHVDVVLDPGKARVFGTVSVLEGGVTQLLPGAQVVYGIRDTDRTDFLPVAITRTAADGSYALENLPHGSFRLEAIRDLDARFELKASSSPGDNLELNLVIPIPADIELGTVSGRVVLPTGDGVEGAEVLIGVRAALTGADGSFVLKGVPVKSGQSQRVFVSGPKRLRHGEASVVVSVPGQMVEGVIVTLSGLGGATFTVKDSNGEPLSNQLVRLLGGCANLCGCASSTTNGLGEATFADLAPGTHFAKVVLIGSDFVDVATGSARVDGDGATGSGLLQFQGVGSVTGTVLLPGGIDPAMGADVSLTSQTFNRDNCELRRGASHATRTDAAGHFSFGNVNFGQISVTASHPFANTKVGDSAVLTKDTPVDFELELVDTTAGVLSGTVFLPDGVTTAGAGVTLTAIGPLPEIEVRTDVDGHYAFAEILPQGMYTLTVSDVVTGFVAREQLYLRAGKDAQNDFRLKGRGSVTVRVVDAGGTPVPSAFVKLTESDYPNSVFEAVVEPSNDGVVSFTNVFEGPFSVEAQDIFGRDGGRVPSMLPGPDQTLELEVRLNAVGVVKGHFSLPGGTPIPFGVVKLIASGRVIGQATTAGAGDIGSFQFDYVPIGPVRLEAQDPLTARRGFVTGELLAQDETLLLDVEALGLGRVEGTVLANGIPQPSARVDLVSGTFRAGTTADDNGFYFLEGVPEGLINATASLGDGFLAGTGSGTLMGDGAALVLDVSLRDSTTVIGKVTEGGGAPAPPSLVTLRVGGVGGATQSTTTDLLDGSYRFERVPAGLATIDVEVLSDIDRAQRIVDLLPAQTMNIDFVLNGVGTLTVTAHDGNGLPTAGRLVILGTGDFPYFISLVLSSAGHVELPDILAGPVSVTLEAGGLFGTASGLVPRGAPLALIVKLEPSGIVKGNAFLAGAEPARGADVTLTLSDNRGILTTQTRFDGAFEFRGVPLGGFDLRVVDPFTGGVGILHGLELHSEGELIDNLVIDLDASPAQVVGVDPENGAVDVVTSQPVRVTFSDPVASLNGALNLLDGERVVSASGVLALDGLSATISTPLPDATQITVRVSTALVDIFGRRPTSVFTSSFRTVDLSPPAAVTVTPASGAFEVDAATFVLVTFDEPLADATDFATLLSLRGPAGLVAGASARAGVSDAQFTPAVALADNTVYDIVVNGAVDELGNTQTVPVTIASFATRDTVAPTLTMFSPAANGWVALIRPIIQITLADNASGIDPQSAVLELDGISVDATISGSRLVFTPDIDLVEGQHSLAGAIADRAGNIGSFSGDFGIDVTPPEAPTLTAPTADSVLADTVHFAAVVADDLHSGIVRIDLINNGSLFRSLAPPNFEADYDTSVLPEGPSVLTARAIDAAGNTGAQSAGVSVRVDNRPLRVSFFQPADDARVRDAVNVSVSVSEPATRVDFEIGGVIESDPTPPYQATVALSAVDEGPQTLIATAFGLNGDTGFNTRKIVIDRTPPAPPNASLVFAEPPQAGASLVHGLPGAVERSARVNAVNLTTLAATETDAGADGSFALSLTAGIGDVISLTATDDLDNQSTPTETIVRSLPSLPPSESSTRLRFDGLLVDRLGDTTLDPDTELDAVFSVELDVGDSTTRDVDFIDLEGPTLKSTRPAAGGILGVTFEPGGAFVNDVDTGAVSVSATGNVSLTLFITDFGFVQEGFVYTVKVVFIDGSEFVGTTTIIPPGDERNVPHSLRITASPSTVLVPSGGLATTIVTIDNIRDIEGTPVPDGVRVALSVADMATADPYDNLVRSAGGEVLDGVPAANNSSFRVFTVSGGMFTAEISTGSIVPAPVMGALIVVQALAADDAGNVLGGETIGTFDLNVRADTDRATVTTERSSLYGDKASRRTAVHVSVRDTFGDPLLDGTRVLLTARPLTGIVGNVFIPSFGGNILGGLAESSDQYGLFTTVNGEVVAEYETPASAFAQPGTVELATIQVLLSKPSTTSPISQQALGSATVSITGAAGAEIDVFPESLPLVFPERQLQIRVRHVHDARGNLVPDDAKVIVSAVPCTTRGRTSSSPCPPADGGSIVDGTPSPNNSQARFFSLTGGALNATYSPAGVLPGLIGQTRTAGIHVAMADVNGLKLTQREVAYRGVPLITPLHAVGTADPPTVLADGNLRTTTVTFSSIRDAYGNPLPDGARVAVSTRSNIYRLNGSLIPSVDAAQILNGEPSFSFNLFTIQDGSVIVEVGIDNLTLAAGAVQTANVMMLPTRAGGSALLGNEVLGVVPVPLAAITSASAVAQPTQLQADGADRRAMITISDLRDALGNPIPDGVRVGLATHACATRVGGLCTAPTATPAVLGGEETLIAYEIFTVRNGQIVAEISTSGINVLSGSKTAIVQVAVVRPTGGAVPPNEAVATVEIELVPPSTDRVAVSPVDLFADGSDQMTQVTLTLGSFTDGEQVALTVDDCAAEDGSAACIPSFGGTILGPPANDARYRLFTVVGGQVQAAYSSAGLTLGVGRSGVARISVVPTDGAGNILSPTALATGEVRLRGATGATASGIASLPLVGGETAVTFAGIRDAIGNIVPDGTTVLVSVADGATRDELDQPIASVGGTLTDGNVSSAGPDFRAYSVIGGAVTVTYSTAGATVGTAHIQLAPAQSDGTRIGERSLIGGDHEVTLQ